MKNCKGELLTALVAAIKTALPTISVTTKKIDIETSDISVYPYIFIGNVFQTENGPKDQYFYEIELLIQVVFKNQIDLGELYEAQDAILGLFTHPKSLVLAGGFEIMNTVLISSNDTEIQSDTGTINIGLIRMRFDIQDNN